ncbi:SVOP [Symbiodinium natans]|uniref:SVOP protein n=1 Tax=Symbiodinium natans TaxID=878477 RepID=A0A812USP0_9DINO|nr:SVOP [Symbiodinium natans]
MVLLPAGEQRSPMKGKRSLQTVVEDIGFGPAQIVAGVLGGGIWVADGSELLILGSVTRAVSDEWNLNGLQRGLVVSIVFVGILLGNTCSGPLGDGLGRKLPILLSYLGIALFSVLSASATGFWSMSGVRMLVGFAFGLGQPAATTLLNEVSPRRWRYMLIGQAMALFCFGELYAAWLIWLDDPMMKSLDWRWLCMVGAVPSIVGLVLGYLFLDESPSYLDENGYREEALTALESLKARNGAVSISCEYETAVGVAQTPKSVRDHVVTIFSPSLLLTTITMMYSCFMLNLVFYGSLYAFPQVFTDSNNSSHSPAMVLMIGAMVEWPGFLGAPILEKFITGKTMMLCSSSFCAISLLSLVIGANGHGTLYGMLLQFGFIGIKTTISILFVTAYTLASSAFPTAARTTGTAACVAAGRVGGILAPLMFEQLRYAFGGWEPFFLVLAGGYLLNFLVVCPLKLDAEEDGDGENLPLVSSKPP